MKKHKRKNIKRNNYTARREVINKGFSEAGASIEKKVFKRWNASSGSANEDIHYNLQRLRERSRSLSMNGGLALSALKTNRTNVIGCGLIYKAKIDKEVLGLTNEEAIRWQNNAEREFSLWADNKRNCDSVGMNDFYKMQQLVFLSSEQSGDCVTVLQHDSGSVNTMNPYSLKLNVVEADRISTPNTYSNGIYTLTDGYNKGNKHRIYDGVEVDEAGKIVAYHICNKHKNEFNGDPIDWVRVSAYGEKTGLPNIIHTVSDIERPGQYRGIPILAASIEKLKQVDRYTSAELMAALVEALFTAFIKTESTDDAMPMSDTETDEGTGPPLDDSEYAMGSGTVLKLRPGEDVSFGDPKRPSGGFTSFVEMAATLVGSSMEIPKELLLKEFNSSYSASRAALLEFWKSVKMKREWFVSDFCRPILEVWMYEAVALGRLNAPGFLDNPIVRQAWLGADFVGPSQGMLDPTKEITAEQMMCENGFSSRADSAIRLNGSEYYRNIESLKSENEALNETTNSSISDVVKSEYVKKGAGGGTSE